MTNFLSVLQVHDYLDELFLQHQEVLLQLDLARAAERLRHYDPELDRHMQIEEELLLPVYARAGRIPGGPPEFFTGEHQRKQEFLTRIVATLNEMQQNNTNLPRRVIALFDDEAMLNRMTGCRAPRSGQSQAPEYNTRPAGLALLTYDFAHQKRDCHHAGCR